MLLCCLENQFFFVSASEGMRLQRIYLCSRGVLNKKKSHEKKDCAEHPNKSNNKTANIVHRILKQGENHRNQVISQGGYLNVLFSSNHPVERQKFHYKAQSFKTAKKRKKERKNIKRKTYVRRVAEKRRRIQHRQHPNKRLRTLFLVCYGHKLKFIFMKMETRCKMKEMMMTTMMMMQQNRDGMRRGENSIAKSRVDHISCLVNAQ